MKSLKYILIIAGLTLILPSCFDDETLRDQIKASTNLIGFDGSSQALSAVTDGEIYNFNIPVKAFGPTSNELTGSAQVTFSVDESASTAIAGTHYNLPTTNITLSEEGDFLGVLPIEVLTEGIQAPLSENPKLVLNVDQVTGGSNVIASGKQITLTLFYLCYSDLSGTYLVTNDACSPSFTVEITKNVDGSWHLTSADGGFLSKCTPNASLLNAGNIVELCGAIQPTGNLDFGSDGGSYDIGDITGGTWDADNGILTMTHTQSLWSTRPGSWTSTYVRQ